MPSASSIAPLIADSSEETHPERVSAVLRDFPHVEDGDVRRDGLESDTGAESHAKFSEMTKTEDWGERVRLRDSLGVPSARGEQAAALAGAFPAGDTATSQSQVSAYAQRKDDSQRLGSNRRDLVVVAVLLSRVDVQATPLGTGCRGRELSEFRCEALELVVRELGLLFLEKDDIAAVNCSGRRVGQPRREPLKGRRRTRDGQLLEQVVGIGRVKQVDKLDAAELRSDDRRKLNRLVLVERAGRLERVERAGKRERANGGRESFGLGSHCRGEKCEGKSEG